MIASFEVGGAALDAELALAFNDDVHSFVRSGLSTKAVNERARYARHLEQRYHELRPERTGRADDPEVRRLREHLLYYIGRLGLPQRPDVLLFAYGHEEEPVVRRAAALGAILHGDRELEADYLSRLEHDEGEQRLNRAVQLVYFGDVIGDVHTATDPGGPWPRTRQAIFDRLGGEDERARRLRWWDVVTLRSFLASRPRSKLSRSEREVLQAVRSTASDDERGRRVAALVEEVLRADRVVPDDRSA